MKLLNLGFAFLLSLGVFAQENLADGLYAKITTDKGDIIIQLEYEKVPMTVASFVALAEGKLEYDTVVIDKPFFDSLTFHRVLNNFMIQGGDPLGTGMGSPGYLFPDEIDSSLTHSGPGILSMANSGKNTNGSQFFITHKDTPWLNGKHAVFGHVVQGQEVVNAIKQNDVMKTVEIIRVGKKAKKFKANKVFNAKVKEAKAKIDAELAAKNQTFKLSVIEQFPNAVQTKSGMMYEILQAGSGVKPVSGAKVEVHYTGTFLDGKKFDSSVDRNKTFTFVLDAGQVIKGWDEGVKLCDIGGKIKLILPHWLAYGESGRGAIPPNTTLVFEVEVIGSGSAGK